MDIQAVQKRLAAFAAARDWEQFHSPKNLSMALAAEAAELIEIFQWMTEEQSREIVHSSTLMKPVREEIADVFIYLVMLADKLGVDVGTEVDRKIRLNEKKYPPGLSRGSSVKYSRREHE